MKPGKTFDPWFDPTAPSPPSLDPKLPLRLTPDASTFNLLYDLLDVAHRYGEGRLVDKADWRNFFYRGSELSEASLNRYWDRWVAKVRRSPWPALWSEGTPPEGVYAGSVRYVIVPPGFSEEGHKILDAKDRAKELSEALRMAKDYGFESWFVAAVAAGVHKEIRCQQCGAEPGVSCEDTGHQGRTTVHAIRVKAALEARETEDDE